MYDEMLAVQGGVCAICGKSNKPATKRLAVDHNHETDRTRGLLCDRCNVGIGHAKENLEVLEEAIAYLEENEDGNFVQKILALNPIPIKDEKISKDRGRAMKKKYGIDVATYEKILAAQECKCAICGISKNDAGVLAIDHDHPSGAVRGLLCGRCNCLLGAVYDDCDILKKMIDYLQEYKEAA